MCSDAHSITLRSVLFLQIGVLLVEWIHFGLEQVFSFKGFKFSTCLAYLNFTVIQKRKQIMFFFHIYIFQLIIVKNKST